MQQEKHESTFKAKYLHGSLTPDGTINMILLCIVSVFLLFFWLNKKSVTLKNVCPCKIIIAKNV